MEFGIDIVQINRLENVDLFSNKILSEKEKAIFLKKENKKEFLAGRFASKEAFIKAMNLNILSIDLKNIEVLNEENGKPYILYNNNKFKVSISHEKEYAVAIVIL